MLAFRGFRLQKRIALDNRREAALQAYLTQMVDRIDEYSSDDDKKHLEETIRVRTLLLLRSLTMPPLDAERKGSVLQFLYESHLLGKGESNIDLTGADLRGANLRDANLRDANLREAILTKADLSRGANLSGANLSGANLSGANLLYAKLAEVDLQGAKYNPTVMQEKDAQRKIITTIEPTQWPQGFDLNRKWPPMIAVTATS